MGKIKVGTSAMIFDWISITLFNTFKRLLLTAYPSQRI